MTFIEIVQIVHTTIHMQTLYKAVTGTAYWPP